MCNAGDGRHARLVERFVCALEFGAGRLFFVRGRRGAWRRARSEIARAARPARLSRLTLYARRAGAGDARSLGGDGGAASATTAQGVRGYALRAAGWAARARGKSRREWAATGGLRHSRRAGGGDGDGDGDGVRSELVVEGRGEAWSGRVAAYVCSQHSGRPGAVPCVFQQAPWGGAASGSSRTEGAGGRGRGGDDAAGAARASAAGAGGVQCSAAVQSGGREQQSDALPDAQRSAAQQPSNARGRRARRPKAGKPGPPSSNRGRGPAAAPSGTKHAPALHGAHLTRRPWPRAPLPRVARPHQALLRAHVSIAIDSYQLRSIPVPVGAAALPSCLSAVAQRPRTSPSIRPRRRRPLLHSLPVQTNTSPAWLAAQPALRAAAHLAKPTTRNYVMPSRCQSARELVARASPPVTWPLPAARSRCAVEPRKRNTPNPPKSNG